MTKNIILFNGGESDEHEISLLSCRYLKEVIQKIQGYKVHEVMISKEGKWTHEGAPCHLKKGHILQTKEESITIHGTLPYLHGHPGETGHLLALLEMHHIPYLGPSQESAVLTFNKISTKLWLEAFGIPTTPSIALDDLKPANLERAQAFFQKYGAAFIKASNQGSSRGCYLVKNESELKECIEKAFSFSPYILLEKPIKGRELEVALYEYKGQLRVTDPGEIIPPPKTFYNYEEKYSENSSTKVLAKSKELPDEISQNIKSYALKAFELFKMSDLGRIDFLYSQADGLLLSEINIFPGLTPISLFPQMLREEGVCFQDFISDRLKKFFSQDIN